MGIAGAGNAGTLIAILFAPRVAQRFGWGQHPRIGNAPCPYCPVPVCPARERESSSQRTSDENETPEKCVLTYSDKIAKIAQEWG